MTYLELLKMLLPYGCYSDSDMSETIKDLSVQAAGIETCQSSVDGLLSEIFPDAADALLDGWERVYGLNNSDRPAFQRLQALLAAINARNGLSKAHVQAALRPFTGYDVQIDEYTAFRCDDPLCLTDDGLYAMDPEYVFQFRVCIDNALLQTAGYNPADIQKVIDRVKPAHTTGVLDTGVYGFFCDDPGSLTDLTLLAL